MFIKGSWLGQGKNTDQNSCYASGDNRDGSRNLVHLLFRAGMAARPIKRHLIYKQQKLLIMYHINRIC